jgi:ATP-dependent DNA ligase
MLCERLTDPRRLADRHYIAEPQLDGQRASSTSSTLKRPVSAGEGLISCATPVWRGSTRSRGPFDSAILDGEACAGDGHERIQAVFEERTRIGGDMALVLFDVLHLDGKSVMKEPWHDRRKRLEDVFVGQRIPRIAVVPVTEDAAQLYETWVGMGGEALFSRTRRHAIWRASGPRRG